MKPKNNFIPTAMKCTQEEFDGIKGQLIDGGCNIDSLEDFDAMPYLINYRFEVKNNITNYLRSDLQEYTAYETFNAKTFLQNCGIEQTYTITKSDLDSNLDLTLREWFMIPKYTKQQAEEKFNIKIVQFGNFVVGLFV